MSMVVFAKEKALNLAYQHKYRHTDSASEDWSLALEQVFGLQAEVSELLAESLVTMVAICRVKDRTRLAWHIAVGVKSDPYLIFQTTGYTAGNPRSKDLAFVLQKLVHAARNLDRTGHF